MDFKELDKLLKDLPDEKKAEIIQQFNDLIGFSDMNRLRETKFTDKIACPGCGTDEHVVCYGTINTKMPRQRYLCKACINSKGKKGLTFNDCTSGALSKLRFPEKWPVYLELMLNGLSVRAIADRLHISPTTSLAWRHKILDMVMKQMTIDIVSGIVEIKEVPVKPSRKGLPRQTSISDQASAVSSLVIIQDRHHRLILGTEQKSMSLIERSAQNQNSDPVTWLPCGQMSANLRDRVTKSPNKPLTPVSSRLLGNTRRVALLSETFHYMHSVRMRGVATRNLPKYAAWQQFLSSTESLQPIARLKELIRLCV